MLDTNARNDVGSTDIEPRCLQTGRRPRTRARYALSRYTGDTRKKMIEYIVDALGEENERVFQKKVRNSLRLLRHAHPDMTLEGAIEMTRLSMLATGVECKRWVDATKSNTGALGEAFEGISQHC